jgi:hypothetical protein
MPNTVSELEKARRQAAKARAQLELQKTLVRDMRRRGLDAGRAQRVLTELTLAAELLQDRVLQLENLAIEGAV